MQLVMESQKEAFVKASEHLGIRPLTGTQVKNLKNLAMINHILLKRHDAKF